MKSTNKMAWCVKWLAVLSYALAGCVSEDSHQENGEVTGAAMVALTQVPSDVSCLRVIAAGASRTETKSMGLSPGQSTAQLMISGLPLGTVTFTAFAFSAACSSALANADADWFSDPVPAKLVRGEVAQVSLSMKRNGKSQVSIDFPTAEVSTDDNCNRTPIASPPASSQHVLAYDAGRGLVVLVSSADGSPAGSAVVYELDVAHKAWSRVETSGPAPTARSSAGLAYDRRTGLFVLFGGADGSASGQPRDVWEYGACTWRDRTPATLPSDWPSARWAPAMTFDFATQRVAMTTGLQHFTYQWEDSAADGTVYEWDSTAGTFVARAPLGTPPTNRGGAVASADPNRRVLYLFAGLQQGENPSSGWDTKLYVWDGAAGTWSVRQPAGAPSAREFAASFFDTVADRFVVAGGVWYGWLNTPEYNQYDPGTDTWSSIGPDASYNRFWSPIAFDEANGVGIQFSGEIADTVYYGSGPSSAPADARQFAGGAVTTLLP